MSTSEWSRYYDDLNRRYYFYNVVTKESRWDAPDEVVGVSHPIRVNEDDEIRASGRFDLQTDGSFTMQTNQTNSSQSAQQTSQTQIDALRQQELQLLEQLHKIQLQQQQQQQQQQQEKISTRLQALQ
eukprot:c17745_g1_i1.p2 GENE.c17745_g1_i1~~c17745_g1_i1.p2  ORF type:complete len:138 (+),score=30.42 c17745_g1_i1:34-414(+)